MSSDFLFEYQFTPLPESEELLSQALDFILSLILEDIRTEQKEYSESKDEKC